MIHYRVLYDSSVVLRPRLVRDPGNQLLVVRQVALVTLVLLFLQKVLDLSDRKFTLARSRQ